MATLPARVDLNGQVLHVAMEVCDDYCLPFAHTHTIAHGRDDAMCAHCFCWIMSDSKLLVRHINCSCEEGCHVLTEPV